jgi:hypothetical protein
MRALVVYESMYGNTHAVADAIGRGLARGADVAVVPVGRAGSDAVAEADLVVVGGPTHAHGMTRASTRKAAADQLAKGGTLVLEPEAAGPGLREWFESLAGSGGKAAAFDTRVAVPAAVSGRASKGIAKRLRERGWQLVENPESFLVDKENHLKPGEELRAEQWGAKLAEAAMRPPG